MGEMLRQCLCGGPTGPIAQRRVPPAPSGGPSSKSGARDRFPKEGSGPVRAGRVSISATVAPSGRGAAQKRGGRIRPMPAPGPLRDRMAAVPAIVRKWRPVAMATNRQPGHALALHSRRISGPISLARPSAVGDGHGQIIHRCFDRHWGATRCDLVLGQRGGVIADLINRKLSQRVCRRSPGSKPCGQVPPRPPSASGPRHCVKAGLRGTGWLRSRRLAGRVIVDRRDHELALACDSKQFPQFGTRGFSCTSGQNQICASP